MESRCDSPNIDILSSLRLAIVNSKLIPFLILSNFLKLMNKKKNVISKEYLLYDLHSVYI